MKKIIVLLLALIALFSVPSASADNVLIKFRDLPWGYGLDYIQLHLAAEMQISDFHTEESPMPYSASFNDLSLETGVLTEQNCGFYSFASIPASAQISVGGYSVRNVQLYAHYSIYNNTISKEQFYSDFYAGGYTLSVDNAEAAYRDLQGKLSYLYGIDYEEVKQKLEYSGVVYQSTWYGAFDTAISMYCFQSSGEIVLIYYRTDVDETLADIDRTVKQMNIIENHKNSDLSGL